MSLSALVLNVCAEPTNQLIDANVCAGVAQGLLDGGQDLFILPPAPTRVLVKRDPARDPALSDDHLEHDIERYPARVVLGEDVSYNRVTFFGLPYEIEALPFLTASRDMSNLLFEMVAQEGLRLLPGLGLD